MGDADDEAAVDHELREFGAALVAVPAVPDEQFRQVAELRHGKVSREAGLLSFLSDDADANICGLDHRDVIAAVADAADAFFGVRADEVGDVGFLGRGAAAGDDGREAHGGGNEGVAVVLEHEGEGFAVDEEAGVGFAAEEGEGVEGLFFAAHCVALLLTMRKCVSSGGLLTFGDDVDVLAARDEFRAYSNASCRLDLVPSQHPYLDASIP